ncbi:hypothetical protein J437_LFUL004400 [Ladona fulva]|uniref:Uncharacterized protein n=1 Tax=Ladona fulva TaxID=123851 RepID=A0A8K0K1V8_LADFU|nr:hypothetical protein J437_LFUL004400 [Ladona fulva]
MSLWYGDTAGLMDNLDHHNAGLSKRRNFTKLSRPIDMIGCIHSDIFNQDKFLLNGVELRIKMIRSRDSFCLMSDTPYAKVKIMDATLLVRRVCINPSVLIAHSKTLEKSPAKYPLTRVEVKVLTISSGVQCKVIDNIFIGQLPKRCIIGFVTNSAFNAFDLTPDLSSNLHSHWNLVRQGSLRLDALLETLTCVIYAEFDNIIEIDRNRNVLVDFGG